MDASGGAEASTKFSRAVVNSVLVVVFAVVGVALLLMFFLHVRSCERRGVEPPLTMGLFKNRTSNYERDDSEGIPTDARSIPQCTPRLCCRPTLQITTTRRFRAEPKP